MEHNVYLSKQAIAQMLLNSFEAFIIKHDGQRRSGIELYASLYGWIKEEKKKHHHHIEFISVDTTADMNGGYVAFNQEAQYLKEHLAEQIGYNKIGGLHTHPYLSHEGDMKFMRAKGSHFSDADLDLFRSILISEEKEHLVEVVLSIKQNERQNTLKDGFMDCSDNVFEFSIGNCKCFLRVQAFTLDDKNCIQHEKTILHNEFLQDFEHFFADFGRIRPEKGKKRILQYVIP